MLVSPYAFTHDPDHDGQEGPLYIPDAWARELEATAPGPIIIAYRFHPGYADVEVEHHGISDAQYDALVDMTMHFLDSLGLPHHPYDRVLTLYINPTPPDLPRFTVEDE